MKVETHLDESRVIVWLIVTSTFLNFDLYDLWWRRNKGFSFEVRLKKKAIYIWGQSLYVSDRDYNGSKRDNQLINVSEAFGTWISQSFKRDSY
jgi:hypothetical protein